MTATLSPTAPIIKNGVKPSRIYLPPEKRFLAGSLLDFLASHFDHIPRQVWQARLVEGLISTVAGEVLSVTSPYLAGQTLYYYRAVAEEAIIPVTHQILHIDEHLIVVDKPHFLPVIPTGHYVQQTLLTRLRQQPALQSLNIAAITPLHRLDKDTAGVILFSHNPATRSCYQQLFEQKAIHKTYEAIASTRTDLRYPYQITSRLVRGEPFYLTKTVPGTANAITTIELNENMGEYSRYRLYPVTGKKHQLRVHMASLGMPILNDPLYGIHAHSPTSEVDYTHPLNLLAKSLTFIDPLSGLHREFTSQLSLT